MSIREVMEAKLAEYRERERQLLKQPAELEVIEFEPPPLLPKYECKADLIAYRNSMA